MTWSSQPYCILFYLKRKVSKLHIRLSLETKRSKQMLMINLYESHITGGWDFIHCSS